VLGQQEGSTDMHVLRHRTLLHGFQTAALLAAALTLAACAAARPSDQGDAIPSSTRAAASPALAQALSHLDRVVVLRSDAFPQNHLYFSFPAKVTVSDPTQVQAVAQALLALPAMPSGTMYVPADLGITYRLFFATADQSLPAIVVAATGAQTVRGLGDTRWVARSPGFWVTLGSAMGLAQPTNATFRGSRPNG
jgi:hypothetical protein